MNHPGPLTDDEYRAVAQHLDALVREFEQLPLPQVRDKVFDLLQTVDLLHRAGLNRLVDFLQQHGQADLLDRAAQDPVIQTLFVLYDLAPIDDFLAEPPSSTAPTPGSFIALDSLGPAPRRQPRRPVFKPVAPVADIPPGTLKHYDVDGVPVLVANIAGEIYAVRDQCPGSMAPLSLGQFTSPIVVCPWHNEAFDVRTGRRVDGQPGPALDVLPISVQGDIIQLAVTTATQPSGFR